MGGYPKAQVGVLFCLIAVFSFSFECIFPFVNQFLLEIGVVKDPADAGYYSGIIESVFSICQLATVFPATWASNIYGRKPVALIGSVGAAASLILFGTSKSYWRMIFSRSLGGVLGGSETAIRVMANELSSKESEAKVFTGIVISYRIGQITGQPVGGLLVHPARNFPALFDTPFWREYPYALPCFVGAFYALTCAVIGQLVLKETLKSKQPKKPVTITEENTPLLDGVVTPPPNDQKSSTPSIASVLSWPLASLLICNATMVLITEILFAVYPLFAFTPIELGGLGLSEAKIGMHMSVRSLMHVFAMFFYAPLEKRYGRMTMYRLSLISFLPTLLIFPALNLMARRGMEGSYLWNTTLAVMFAIWSVTGWGWSSIFLLLSAYAPSAEAMATVQGLLSVSVNGPQAFAPALGTTAFAISLNYQNILSGSVFWLSVFTLSAVAVVHSFTLRESTHDWRAEQSEEVAEAGHEAL